MIPLTPGERGVHQPHPADVETARKQAKLTQQTAGKLLNDKAKNPFRAWQSYEADPALSGARAIPLATWELFLLLTGQHPTLELQPRKTMEEVAA